MSHDLEKAIATSERTGNPVGLAIVDLDHFKRVNDRHGHAAGDAVLVAFSELLCASLRKADGVYRLGGEEFLLLMPGAGEEALAKVTETLRATIETRLRGPEGNLTASLGAACLRPGESAQAWLARADSALYRAKSLGRNRACVDCSAQSDEAAAPIAADAGPPTTA
jgi:diguanylate cyclase (GGDEF)-like protein